MLLVEVTQTGEIDVEPEIVLSGDNHIGTCDCKIASRRKVPLRGSSP